MIVEIDNIELSFKQRRILYGVYLKAETGKITGILGRNGSGKTSLIQILFGTLTAKYSNIRIDGNHLKKELYKTGIAAYLPQHQLLPSNLKLNKVFSLFDSDWNSFTTLFPSFKKYEKTIVNKLSSGERRVIETYLTIDSNKKITLLDEPFSFIAPVYVERIKQLIKVKSKNKVIILTDHFYREIIEMSDSVYLLKEGRSRQIHSETDLKTMGYIP